MNISHAVEHLANQHPSRDIKPLGAPLGADLFGGLVMFVCFVFDNVKLHLRLTDLQFSFKLFHQILKKKKYFNYRVLNEVFIVKIS